MEATQNASPASLPPLLGEDDDLILDEDEKVAALNLFFSRVATTFDSSKFRADHFEGVVQALSRNAAAFLPDTASDVSENVQFVRRRFVNVYGLLSSRRPVVRMLCQQS